MHTVLEDQLRVNLPPEAIEDSDTFRNQCLYTEACDSVLQVREHTTDSEKCDKGEYVTEHIIRCYIEKKITSKFRGI